MTILPITKEEEPPSPLSHLPHPRFPFVTRATFDLAIRVCQEVYDEALEIKQAAGVQVREAQSLKQQVDRVVAEALDRQRARYSEQLAQVKQDKDTALSLAADALNEATRSYALLQAEKDSLQAATEELRRDYTDLLGRYHALRADLDARIERAARFQGARGGKGHRTAPGKDKPPD